MNFNKGECVMEKIAVLIPCYNEEKTIKNFQRQQSMYITIIPQIVQ